MSDHGTVFIAVEIPGKGKMEYDFPIAYGGHTLAEVLDSTDRREHVGHKAKREVEIMLEDLVYGSERLPF